MKITKFVLPKSVFPIESIALNAILANENVTIEELNQNHTDTDFVWEKVEITPYYKFIGENPNIKEDENENENENKPPVEETEEVQDFSGFKISKEKTTEKEATEAAMLFLDTFEGNLQAVHTENEFVFEKIRG